MIKRLLPLLLAAAALLVPAGAAADGNEFLGQSYRAILPGGGLVSDGVGLARRAGGPASAAIEIAGIPSDAVVERAFLYWTAFNAPDPSVVFAGAPVSGALIGQTAGFCLGSNFAYRADVTDRVGGNGSYAISGVGEVVDATGASLVVAYSRPVVARPALVIVNDGLIEGASGATDGELISTGFTSLGITQIPPSARLHIGMGEGNEGTAQGPMRFAGAEVTTANPFWSADGPRWDDATIDLPPSLLPPGTTEAAVSMWTVDDCLLWTYAALEVVLPLPPVQILAPDPGSVVRSEAVAVSGTAGAATGFVALHEGARRLAVTPVEGGTWQATIDLGPDAGGHRTITAVGLDEAMQELSPSDSVAVVSDTRAPVVTLHRPEAFPPSFQEMEVSGETNDDLAVSGVTVYAVNLVTGEEYSATAECWGCGYTQANFDGRLEPFPGPYRVWAEATDPAGRTGSSEAIAVQLFSPFEENPLPFDPFEIDPFEIDPSDIDPFEIIPPPRQPRRGATRALPAE